MVDFVYLSKSIWCAQVQILSYIDGCFGVFVFIGCVGGGLCKLVFHFKDLFPRIVDII